MNTDIRPVQEPKTPSRLRGLKRFGTVLSRNKRNSMMPLGQDSQSPERKEKSKSPFSSLGGRGRSKEQTSSSLAPPPEEPKTLPEEDDAPSRADPSEPATDGINGTASESLGRPAYTDGAGSLSDNRLQEPLQPSSKAEEPEVSLSFYAVSVTRILTA